MLAILATTLLLAGIDSDNRLVAIDQSFVCPEDLPDTASKNAAVERFLKEMVAAVPDYTVDQTLKYRFELLQKHHCEATLRYLREHPETDPYRQPADTRTLGEL